VEENILQYLKDEWSTERTPLYPSCESSRYCRKSKLSEFEELGWNVYQINVPQQLSGSNDCGIGSLLFLFQMFKFEGKVSKGDKFKYPYDGCSYSPFRMTLAASLLDRQFKDDDLYFDDKITCVAVEKPRLNKKNTTSTSSTTTFNCNKVTECDQDIKMGVFGTGDI
jgi:hypothetical protein